MAGEAVGDLCCWICWRRAVAEGEEGARVVLGLNRPMLSCWVLVGRGDLLRRRPEEEEVLDDKGESQNAMTAS